MEAELQSAIVSLARIRTTNNFPMYAHARRTELLNRKVDRVRVLLKTEAASAVALDEAQTEAKISEMPQRGGAQLAGGAAELKREEAMLNRTEHPKSRRWHRHRTVMFAGE